METRIWVFEICCVNRWLGCYVFEFFFVLSKNIHIVTTNVISMYYYADIIHIRRYIESHKSYHILKKNIPS